jgi:hypothetical protein
VRYRVYLLEKDFVVFEPLPMRRLYLVVPIENEGRVIGKIGEMGTVQLFKETNTGLQWLNAL